MKTKRKFINVSPKTNESKYCFIDNMDSLHAMVVEKETNTQYFVISINNSCSFWLNKKDDPYWEILK